MDDRISEVAIILTSQSDVTHDKHFIFFLKKKNETHADISSDLKCFSYALEGKCACRLALG
jgi:hypothetical protein